MRALGIPAEKLTSWSVAEDSVSMDMDMTTGGFSEYHLEGDNMLLNANGSA